MPKWDITKLFVDLPVASVVLVLALAFLFYMHKMYQRQLDDRQKEIDRLAEENREYREMFLSFVRAAEKIPPQTSNQQETK
ncbi:hypothetical protein [Candidatus Spongiihabitans sp.]|uniref:hypothetical protein n=1 Tax=Candidatus Spongiihabitans sp. TaxID=3101308 RepID=UPI003C7A0F13